MFAKANGLRLQQMAGGQLGVDKWVLAVQATCQPYPKGVVGPLLLRPLLQTRRPQGHLHQAAAANVWRVVAVRRVFLDVGLAAFPARAVSGLVVEAPVQQNAAAVWVFL